MKILIINSRYWLSAGPERYMFGIMDILQKHGHEIIPFSTKNPKNAKTKYSKYFAEPIGGFEKVYFEEYDKLNLKTDYQMLERQFYSLHVKHRLEQLIRDTKPDIAYILHHANKLSPSVIDACKKYNIPVVMRLSDFFLVCPSEHLYRQGSICEECINGSLMNAVRHRCLKKSFWVSAIKSSAVWFHRMIGIYNKVDYFVSPSIFTLHKVEPFVKSKIVHVPTFIAGVEKYNSHLGDYVLHVGRMEEHKGILDAIKAVKGTDYKLIIVGSSSTSYDEVLKDYVKKNDIRNIEFVGAKFGDELRQLYRSARVVVIPVRWYENMPNVVLEAMMHSRPIIASNLGSMKDLVKDGHNGLLFKPGNIKQLRERIEILFKDDELCKRLSKNSYSEAVTKYNPEKHYNALIQTFEGLIKSKK